MMLCASAIGAFSIYAGLLVSYHFDLAAGAAITLVATVVFFAAFAAVRIARTRSDNRRAAAAVGSSLSERL